MAPEQFAGRAEVGSDLYALGATLVFLLSGRHPAELEVHRMRPEYRDHVQISEPFAQLIDLLLEPAIEDRVRDAESALRALTRVERKRKRKRGLNHRRRTERERREKVLDAEGGSWLSVRVKEDALSVEVPPLHSSRERASALLSAATLAGFCSLASSLPWLALFLATPVGIYAAVRLFEALSSARLLVGRKRYTLRKEIFGVPLRRITGETRSLWVSREIGPFGPMSSLALRDADLEEHRLIPWMTEDERTWLLDVLKAELPRIKSKAELLADPREALPPPRMRGLAVRLNLLPTRRMVRVCY
jgi:hypothetical protein